MLKKTLPILFCLLIAFGLAACGGSGTSSSPSSSSAAGSNAAPSSSSAEASSASSAGSIPQTSSTAAQPKALVIYFSVPETDSPDNMNAEEENSTVVIDGEVLGNTQYVAQVIQENTGADVFRVEPVTPYPTDHAELEAVATREKNEGAYPEIAGQLPGLGQYDTVFIGYPNWYGDLPRIMYTLLEQNDFSGKTIVPFVTSGSSGFSNTINTISQLQPGATVERNGFSVTRDRVAVAEGDIASWLGQLGY